MPTVSGINTANHRSTNFAPHRKNAALRSRSDSPYQQRTTERDNPTQVLIKQAVEHLIRQLEAGKSEALTAYLSAMARPNSPDSIPCPWASCNSPTRKPSKPASLRTCNGAVCRRWLEHTRAS